jgi:hypothetical protein
MLQIATAQVRQTDIAEKPLKGHIKEVIEYTYRGKMNDTTVDTSRQPEKRVLEFNKNGNELEQSWYNANGSLNFKITYNYPADSIAIGDQFGPNGKMLTKNTYKYDNKGRVIEWDPEMMLDFVASDVSKICYKYDNKGNRIEENTYNNKNIITTSDTLIYNEQNQNILLKERGFLKNNVKLFYDSLGNEVKIESYTLDNVLESSIISNYKNIDLNGNWLYSISYDRGSSEYQGNYLYVNITKRHMTYY